MARGQRLTYLGSAALSIILMTAFSTNSQIHEIKGTDKADAMKEYVALIDSLKS